MPYRLIGLTQGNLKNNHLYLSTVMDFFPADAVGGPNDSNLGAQLEIHCGITGPVFTDIAGDKKIFRKRAWVGEFFRDHALTAGSQVIIEKTGPRRYHLYPARG